MYLQLISISFIIISFSVATDTVKVDSAVPPLADMPDTQKITINTPIENLLESQFEEDIFDSVNEMLEMNSNNFESSNNKLQYELNNIAISSVCKSLNSTITPISKVSSKFLEKNQQLLF